RPAASAKPQRSPSSSASDRALNALDASSKRTIIWTSSRWIVSAPMAGSRASKRSQASQAVMSSPATATKRMSPSSCTGPFWPPRAGPAPNPRWDGLAADERSGARLSSRDASRPRRLLAQPRQPAASEDAGPAGLALPCGDRGLGRACLVRLGAARRLDLREPARPLLDRSLELRADGGDGLRERARPGRD